MMERIRRILWSLWARKKETFIIWFLVFILSAFMTLAYASRMANDDILKRIEENIEVSLNFISPELEGYENNILPGSFDSENQAQEHKALIAFQGASSTVVQNSEGKYQLKIGPFANREIGRSEFNKLGEAGLVERCALVDEAKAN